MKDMRQIKFRAWDEQNKIMHHNVQFVKSGDEGNDWICFFSDEQERKLEGSNQSIVFDNPYFRKQIHLMQFAGLLDKNGKEIYEGDIIRRTEGLPLVEKKPPNDIRLPSRSHPQKVIFDEGSFKLRKSNDGKRYSLNSLTIRLGGFEIIGNIYQNSELLLP